MGKIYEVVSSDEAVDSLELSIAKSDGDIIKVPASNILLTVEGGSIEFVREDGEK